MIKDLITEGYPVFQKFSDHVPKEIKTEMTMSINDIAEHGLQLFVSIFKLIFYIFRAKSETHNTDGFDLLEWLNEHI